MNWGRSRVTRRRFSRPVGCLLWLIALILLLVLLSVLFGGFQKGTKVSGSGPVVASAVSRTAVTWT
jgi:hypothetical protein